MKILFFLIDTAFWVLTGFAIAKYCRHEIEWYTLALVILSIILWLLLSACLKVLKEEDD